MRITSNEKPATGEPWHRSAARRDWAHSVTLWRFKTLLGFTLERQSCSFSTEADPSTTSIILA